LHFIIELAVLKAEQDYQLVLMVLTAPVKLFDIFMVKLPHVERVSSGFYVFAEKIMITPKHFSDVGNIKKLYIWGLKLIEFYSVGIFELAQYSFFLIQLNDVIPQGG